jgi:hypothetical protein
MVENGNGEKTTKTKQRNNETTIQQTFKEEETERLETSQLNINH